MTCRRCYCPLDCWCRKDDRPAICGCLCREGRAEAEALALELLADRFNREDALP